MYCKYCGSKNDDSSVYCSKCGKNIGDKADIANPVQNSTTYSSDNSDIFLKYGKYLSLAICIFTALSPFLKVFKIPVLDLVSDHDNNITSEFSVYNAFSFMFHALSSDSNNDDVNKVLLYAAVYSILYIISLISTIKMFSILIKDHSYSESTKYSIISSVSVIAANIIVFVIKKFILSLLQSETDILQSLLPSEIKIVELSGLLYILIIVSVINIIISKILESSEQNRSIQNRMRSEGFTDQNEYENSWVCTCGKRNPASKNYCMNCNKSKELI